MSDPSDYGRHAYEGKSFRTEAKPVEWLGRYTCLIEGCDWSTEVRGPYEMMQRELRRRSDEHQQKRH